jgi:hypothetical protein
MNILIDSPQTQLATAGVEGGTVTNNRTHPNAN